MRKFNYWSQLNLRNFFTHIPTLMRDEYEFRIALTFLLAATKLGQGNKFTGVCLSTGGGGGTWPGPGEVSEILGGV